MDGSGGYGVLFVSRDNIDKAAQACRSTAKEDAIIWAGLFLPLVKGKRMAIGWIGICEFLWPGMRNIKFLLTGDSSSRASVARKAVNISQTADVATLEEVGGRGVTIKTEVNLLQKNPNRTGVRSYETV